MRNASLLVVGALAFSALACQDLDITNPNNPDREVVVESPSDVESLISSSFRRWFNLTQGSTPSMALTCAADEFSSGFTDYGSQFAGAEPRLAVDNNPVAANSPNRGTFSSIYSVIAAVNIGIQAIDKYDLTIISGGTDETERALAFAKFVQGISHSYAALLFDQGWVYSESVDTDTIYFGGESTQVQDLIRPYTEIRDTALAELSAALSIAQSNDFTLPGSYQGDWFPGITTTSQEFAKVIHSYIARTMVYWARTPEERAQVNWAQVITHVDQGITEDFAPSGTPGILSSTYKNRASRQRTTTPGDFMRVDYKLVGPADQSNKFIEWYNTPWENRLPFTMSGVVDKRIVTSPTASCTSNLNNALSTEGSYMGCHVANIFSSSRGTGQRSYYFYHRLGRGTAFETGPLLIMTVAEMDLLKAEALIRLNRAAEAIPLINKTRVANGDLPPVTLDGVPDPSCTPRKLDGTCGSLWDALRWEKRMEGIGVEAGVAHWDGRGWGTFVVDNPIDYPVPGNQLELLGLPYYSRGGGQAGSAPAPDPEKCPAGVTLPRCG